jgi:hypothetical protein
MKEKSGKKIVWSDDAKSDLYKLTGKERAELLKALKDLDFSKGEPLSKDDPEYALCVKRLKAFKKKSK